MITSVEEIDTMYIVTDTQTQQVVKTYNTRKEARKYADRMDLAYGAVRYSVRFVA